MIIDFLKDLVAPKKCYSCGKIWIYLCEECLYNQKNFTEFCYICKLPSYNFCIHQNCKKIDIFYDKVIVLSHYKNKVIKKLILSAKFKWKYDIFNDFWEYLTQLLLKNLEWNTDDYFIIFPPMFFLKKLIRGFNQTEILAKKISSLSNIKLINNLVVKTKNTKSQSKLDKSHRFYNLLNVFKVNKNLINIVKWKNIIIVDDIISTWSTINEISRILKKYWVKSVTAICIASD